MRHSRGPVAVHGQAIRINPGATAKMTILASCAHSATLPSVPTIMRRP
jgi:hypothetical protein